MDNSLMISNVYAAYTAASEKSDKNVSELSKMLKGENADKKEKVLDNNTEMNMDRVVISKEALELLGRA